MIKSSQAMRGPGNSPHSLHIPSFRQPLSIQDRVSEVHDASYRVQSIGKVDVRNGGPVARVGS